MQDLITTAKIWKEGGMYTPYCPEPGIANYGHMPEEVRKSPAELIRIQLEETVNRVPLMTCSANPGIPVTAMS